jgi:alkylation response protein AidB-like acyl-CoA dehydrogenase
VSQKSAVAASRTDTPQSRAHSDEALLARARELIPYLRSKSDEIAEARRLPEEVMQRMKDAGLINLRKPKKFGGPEASMELTYRITEQLGLGDASAAWVYSVLASHDQFMTFFPKNIQEEYWASERPLCASTYNPTGKAVAVQGGYRLTGKWSFCSGIDFCDWVVPGGIVGMLPGDKPVPDFRFFLVHKSQWQLLDDWRVMGLAGSGSKSIVLDNAFVPDERIISESQILSGTTPGAGLHEHPAHSIKGWTIYTFGFPLIGAALVRSAYEDLREDFRGRTARREPLFELRRPAVQTNLSEASALIDTADLLIGRALDETFQHVNEDGEVSVELRLRNRRDLIYGVLNARKAAEILMSMAGGRGINENNRIQRALRDIYALTAHPSLNWDVQGLSFGGIELGLPATDPIF